MKNYRVFWIICSFLLVGYLEAQNSDIRQGEVKILPLPTDSLRQAGTYKAYFDNTEIPIFEYGRRKYILVAVDFEKKPGLYPLRVIKDRWFWHEIQLSVAKGNFETARLNTVYKLKTLPQSVRDSIARVKQPLLSAIGKSDAGQLWQSAFAYPLDTVEVISAFGRTRIYKNHTARHRGTDLRANFGKEVYPISEGRVLWGSDTNFYSEGKLVVIDHGQGIVSMYMHLSRVTAKTGERVTQKTVIGKVGNTGHSFGAHLHLAVKVGKAFVDPVKFIEVFNDLLR